MAGAVHLILGRVIPSLAVIALSGVAGLFGLEMMRARAEGRVYRDRLESLAGDYHQLAERYNAAVRRTAITELAVANNRLSVIVRNAGGRIAEIPTPFDPSGEVYVDYAIIGGRVWIRRVFDAQTPPARAVVIDPALAEIEWDERTGDVGKAIYRSLAEGRWVVTVSGGGALGLRRLEAGEEIELAPAPSLEPLEEIEAEAKKQADRVTWGDLVRSMFGG
jgi:hypothetical protein